MVYPINSSTAQDKIELGLIKVLPLMIILSLLASGAKAAEDNSETEQNGQSSNSPDMEFLEFLGSFETDSGDWIDPTELLQVEFEQLLKDAEALKGKQPDDYSETDSKQERSKDEN